MRVAHVPDLLDRSRLDGIPGVVLVASPGDIVALEDLGPGDVVAVDLSRAGALEAGADAVQRGATVYGFASHVDGETMRAANQAGITAMARSAFFGKVRELFA
jgi:hypothetical protein